jgi:hypothetical protein
VELEWRSVTSLVTAALVVLRSGRCFTNHCIRSLAAIFRLDANIQSSRGNSVASLKFTTAANGAAIVGHHDRQAG